MKVTIDSIDFIDSVGENLSHTPMATSPASLGLRLSLSLSLCVVSASLSSKYFVKTADYEDRGHCAVLTFFISTYPE